MDLASQGKTIIEAVFAFGLIAAILISLADTPFYGLAIAIVGIALLYVLLEHPGAVSALSGAIKGASSKLGG